MKIYPADIKQPVNSQQRKPAPLAIPPFYFKGDLTASLSGKWYGPPGVNYIVTGGYVTASEVGDATANLYMLKNNIFEQDVITGSATLAATDLKTLFTFSEPLTGALTFSPYDWITVFCTDNSNHVNVTVQFYAEVIN